MAAVRVLGVSYSAGFLQDVLVQWWDLREGTLVVPPGGDLGLFLGGWLGKGIPVFTMLV